MIKLLGRIIVAFVFYIGVVQISSAASTATDSATKEEAKSAIQCTGVNLIPAMQRDQPDLANAMRQEADETLYGEGLIWKIEKDGLKPSYLFGTIHLADPRLLALKPSARKALDESTTLALEITEILDPKKLAGIAFSALQYTTYTDGTTLADKLTKEQAETIDAAVREKLGLPWSLASRMKPWALMGALGLPACEMERKKAQLPVVDAYLGQLAQSQDKQIVPLETMIGQLQAMDSLPEDVSLQGLVQSVSLGTRLDDLFETMIQLYLEEQTALVWSLMRRVGVDGFVAKQDSAEYAAFQREIVDRRNITMAAESEKFILQGGGVFIAVGALHLPGEMGMLNILAQKGYRISRIID
ncbi:MAG: TraB/GumN family protein [Rhizobiaceae bacterium]